MYDNEKGFVRGIAWCVQYIGFGHDEPTLAKEMLETSGYKIKDLKQAKVDEYDLVKIKKIIEEK